MRPFSGSSTMRLFSMTVPTVAFSVVSSAAVADNLDGFAHLTDRQFEVDTGALLDLNQNLSAGDGFESGLFDLKVIGARCQGGKAIDAHLIRDSGTSCVGIYVDNSDLCAGDRCAGRITNLTTDVTKGLSECRNEHDKQEKDYCKQLSSHGLRPRFERKTS